MKKRLIASLCALMLLFPAGSFAAGESRIAVSINKLTILVNGQVATGNNFLYDGTTYVPIRNVADMLGGLVLTYDAAGGTVRFTRGEGGAPSASSQNDVRDPVQDTTIQVAKNTIVIMVDERKVDADNFVYKGRTYVPLRAISTILDVEVTFHQPTASVYIGAVPEGALDRTAPQTGGSGVSGSTLYHVPATGEMAGWMLLKGHPYEDVAEFYYKVNGSIVSMHVKDIRQINLNEIVYWVDEAGNQRANRRGDLHAIFGDFGQYIDDWLLARFGDTYYEYLEVSALPAERIIDQYLQDTGQIPRSEIFVTLQPDTIPEKDQPKAGYGTWADGTIVFYAYDKYDEYQGQYIDTTDDNYVDHLWHGMPEPPKLSDGWMALPILEQIYGESGTYANKTLELKHGQDTILRLTFPANWHRLDVAETTASGIRVRKFNDSTALIAGAWIRQDELEAKSDVRFVFLGGAGDGGWKYEFRGAGNQTLLEVVTPGSWNGAEIALNGLRMKREDAKIHFNVEDLKKLNIISGSNEHEEFTMYLNVDDLVAADILK